MTAHSRRVQCDVTEAATLPQYQTPLTFDRVRGGRTSKNGPWIQRSPADATVVTLASLRFRHNTFMSVPLLFTMMSNHFPTLYGSG